MVIVSVFPVTTGRCLPDASGSPSSTAIKAAGDGQNAAHEIIGGVPYKRNEVRERVGKALAYTEQALAPAEILEKTELAEGCLLYTSDAADE